MSKFARKEVTCQNLWERDDSPKFARWKEREEAGSSRLAGKCSMLSVEADVAV